VLGRVGVGVGQERLGEPLADVLLALGACGAEVVDRQPRRHGGEECLGRLDLLTLAPGAVVAEEGLLHDVLRLADASDHAVGDREEQRSELLVDLVCRSLVHRVTP
jgi:hypothetical protein